MTDQTTRRSFLGAAAAIAAAGAAVAIPTVATAQAATTLRRHCPCNPPAPIVGHNRERMDAAWDTLMAAGPAVREAASEYESELAASWLAERALFVAAFARHFPGFERAIEFAAEHVADSSTATFDCDCFD